MFGDLGRMMKMAAELKRRMPEVQAKIEASRFTAESGGGAVSATCNGKGQLTDLRIDPKVLADVGEDAGMLEDLVKAAVSAAQTQATEAAQAAMQELTGGMPLPPGMGL